MNGELSRPEALQVEEHLQSCESCYGLFSDLQQTFGLVEKRKDAVPNPFLYTRIMQQLEDADASRSREGHSLAKRVLQPVLVAAMLFVAVFSGVQLGNAYERRPGRKVVVEKTTAYYLNDLQQEQLEMSILND